jgi:hypothetical protein
VKHGRSVSLVIGVWWRLPWLPSLPDIAAACGPPIVDATRIAIPIGRTGLHLGFGFTVPKICTSMASLSFTVDR